MSNLNLILLGPPGAGKGTQAARLRDDLGLHYLSTGDILRRHRAEGTELGREATNYMTWGRLVPDELVISMLLGELDAAGPGGFLLDGFPRTTAQAYALDRALGAAGRRLTAVLLLDVPDAVVVGRLSGRLTCPRGHIFHARTQPPARPGVCDHDGEPLSVRDDDRVETVRRRLDVYHEVTEPLVGYYEERGVLRSFSGLAAPDAVSAAIRDSLELARAPRFGRTPVEADLVPTPGARRPS